jgi:hypothetical protein
VPAWIFARSAYRHTKVTRLAQTDVGTRTRGRGSVRHGSFGLKACSVAQVCLGLYTDLCRAFGLSPLPVRREFPSASQGFVASRLADAVRHAFACVPSVSSLAAVPLGSGRSARWCASLAHAILPRSRAAHDPLSRRAASGGRSWFSRPASSSLRTYVARLPPYRLANNLCRSPTRQAE